MYDLISSGKNLQLHSFPELDTKYKHELIGLDFEVDFRFVYKTALCKLDKKCGFEMLLLTNDDVKAFHSLSLNEWRTINCIAGNGTHPDIALGSSTGSIHIYNVRAGQFESIRHAKFGNSVIDLDINMNATNMASLHKNNHIKIYDMSTHHCPISFHFANKITKMRFHPLESAYLAITTERGSVAIQDIERNCNIFSNDVAHSRACRDIAMSSVSSNIVISCGDDGNANMYDTRAQNLVIQTNHYLPLSSVSMSPCGSFLCIGDQVGSIKSIDFRNLKRPLVSRNLHNGSVIQTAFISSMNGYSRKDDMYNPEHTYLFELQHQPHGFLQLRAMDGLEDTYLKLKRPKQTN